MTLRFFLWVALFIASFISVHFKLRNFPYIIVFFIGIVPLISYLHTRWIRKKIKISLLNPQEFITRHRTAHWDLSINNPLFNTLFLKIKDQEETRDLKLKPRSNHALFLSEKAEHCGPLQPPGLTLEIYDSFGFFRLPLSMPKDYKSIYAMPLSKRNLSETIQDINHDERGLEQSKSFQRQMEEIEEIRPMRPGDHLKMIHWKLSAKMQEWMVREYKKDEEPSALVIPVLPQEQNTSFLSLRDYILDHLLGHIETLLSANYQVSLMTFSPEKKRTISKSIQELEKFQMQLGMIEIGMHHELSSLISRINIQTDTSIHVFTPFVSDEDVLILRKLHEASTGLRLFFITNSSILEQELKQRLHTLQSSGIIVKRQLFNERATP